MSEALRLVLQIAGGILAGTGAAAAFIAGVQYIARKLSK